jgi:hypothetical protein
MYRPLRILTLALIAAGASAFHGGAQNQGPPFDVVIIHGHIIDGTGSP